MKKLVALIVAGVAASVMALDPVQTQAQEFEQIKVQLQEKLGNALNQVGPDVEEKVRMARQAAISLQNRLKGKNQNQQKDIMANERKETQLKLQAAIDELTLVSAKLGSEVEAAKQQMQTRLQEKMQELKAMQEKLGNGPGAASPGK